MLVSLLAAMSMVVNAEVIEYSTDEGFTYKLSTETMNAELAKYCGSAADVVIPQSVTYEGVTYNVTSLGDYCFDCCHSLKSITIPSSVMSLGSYCFRNCNFKSINIPSAVTSLGDHCFELCELRSINIPASSSMTSMGDFCFSNCCWLETITIPSSVKSLGNECFCRCDSLKSIQIPESVTSLGNGCFALCSHLTSINIPASVTSLGYGCFSGCGSLASVSIPASVTSLSRHQFESCYSLKSITIDEKNKVYDSRENCNAIIESKTNNMIMGCMNTVIPSSVTSLGNGCFAGCEFLKYIYIPKSVTSLEEECFYGCYSLTSVDIPESSSMTSMGDCCFEDCFSLASINIPSSVKSLGYDCFRGCESLIYIKIPSSVTSLGTQCFIDCSSLTTMICEIPTPIEGNFFNTLIEYATLYVPETSFESYKTTYPWSGFGTIKPITTTGIENNTADKTAAIDAIYDLDGKRSNGMGRGMNIIRMADGTTKKVVK